MTRSHVPAMKMRNLILGVVLGLLAVVHSSPVSSVTQDDVYREAVTDGYLIDHDFETKTESPKTNTTVQPSQQPSSHLAESDDFEASAAGATDKSMLSDDGGEHYQTTTPHDKIPQSSWVPDEAQPTESDMMEGSADGYNDWATMFPVQVSEEDATPSSTTTEVPQTAFSSSSEPNEAKPTESDNEEDSAVEKSSWTTTTMVPLHGGEEDASATSSTTEIPSDWMEDNTDSNSVFGQQEDEEDESTTVSWVPSEDESNVTPDTMSAFQTADPAVTSEDFQTSGSGSGSGDDEKPTMVLSSTEPTTLSTTSMVVVEEEIVQGKARSSLSMEKPIRRQHEPSVSHVSEPQKEDTNTSSVENAGHSTPGWIIIVGFIVGLAALVMICVAIATRDKWNGPRQVSQPQPNSSNQQRELEMETFLHKEKPRENGKAAEYTVIPLDEFPDKFSSH